MKQCKMCKKNRYAKKLQRWFSLVVCWKCWSKPGYNMSYRRIYKWWKLRGGIFNPQLAENGKQVITREMRLYMDNPFARSEPEL